MALSDLQKEMERQLEKALDAVIDEATFIQFLNVLSTDWFTEAKIERLTPSSPYSAGPLGWENGNIGAFLDGAARWAETSKTGLKFYEVPDNPWRRAANILRMGKLYE